MNYLLFYRLTKVQNEVNNKKLLNENVIKREPMVYIPARYVRSQAVQPPTLT